MGLDIYLYSQAEHDANKAHEDGWENTWNAYHDTTSGELLPGRTKEEYEAASALVPPYQGSTRKPSEKHPEHYFQRNYLRSSYNDSGFNRAVPDMLGRKATLYDLFEPVIGDNPEPYETVLNEETISRLEQVQAAALQVAEDLRASDPLRVMTVHAPMLGSGDHQWNHLPTEDEVLEWYREEQARRAETVAKLSAESKPVEDEYGYMNAKGTVLGFTKGMEILALTMGANPLARFSAQFPTNTVGGQMGVMPQAIAVYREKDEGKTYYIEAAEIVAEFCEEAIELIKRDGSAVMHWSG